MLHVPICIFAGKCYGEFIILLKISWNFSKSAWTRSCSAIARIILNWSKGIRKQSCCLTRIGQGSLLVRLANRYYLVRKFYGRIKLLIKLFKEAIICERLRWGYSCMIFFLLAQDNHYIDIFSYSRFTEIDGSRDDWKGRPVHPKLPRFDC